MPFNGPYKENESPLYSAFTTFHLHPTSILPICHHLVVSACAVIGHPTLRTKTLLTKTSQSQEECSIITRRILAEWCEWVWCTRLTHYRTVCGAGTCFAATASLVHQLMYTHSPVTVCCVVVCGSPRAEGLTVSPAGRDVVDMVSFLADSEHKRSDVRKQH